MDHPRQADRSWARAPASVAGLVCITPAAGFVTPMPALLMGVAVGIVCFLACTSAQGALRVRRLARRLRRPRRGRHAGRDPDRRVRHPGHRRTFDRRQAARPARRRLGADGPDRRRGRSPGCLAIVATFVILKVLDAVMGLRVAASGGDRGPRPQPARRRRLHLHLGQLVTPA